MPLLLLASPRLSRRGLLLLPALARMLLLLLASPRLSRRLLLARVPHPLLLPPKLLKHARLEAHAPKWSGWRDTLLPLMVRAPEQLA